MAFPPGNGGSHEWRIGTLTDEQTQTQTQQTNSSTAPPSYLQPYLQQGIQALVGDFNANPTAPGYYPGATVAPPSQATQSAIQTLFQRGASGSPVVQAADNSVMSTLNGDYLDLGKNPYFASAVAAAEQPQTKQFMTQVLPSVTRAIRGHRPLRLRPAAGLHGAGAQLAQPGPGQRRGRDGEHGLSERALEPAQCREPGADAGEPGLRQHRGHAAGRPGDRREHAGQIDSNVARYNYNTTAQPNYISNYLQRLLAGYPGGESSGNSSGSSNAATARRPARRRPFWAAFSGWAALGIGARQGGIF